MTDTQTKDNNEIEHTRINEEDYYKSFGIKKEGSKFIVQYPEKVKAAYQKAWENRNYEIDKFWSRALYFWGFIAATFVAYTAIPASDPKQDSITKITDFSIEISILALGIIFSTAWILVIQGSKRWQENWEKHIDYLEDFVSGSIYKTVFYDDKQYYSVSKISEYVAKVVRCGWIFLFVLTVFKFVFANINLLTITERIVQAIILVIILIGIFVSRYFMYKKGRSRQYFIKKDTGEEAGMPSFYVRKRRKNLSENEEIEPEEEKALRVKVEKEEKKQEKNNSDVKKQVTDKQKEKQPRGKQSRSKSDKSQ